MFKKILVPLDGSTHADKALDFALDLAEKYSSEILLLSVISPVPLPLMTYPNTGMLPISPVAIDAYTKEVRENSEKILKQALEKAKKTKPKLEVSMKLVEGRPSEKIIEEAKAEGIDVIIMGSRGLGGIKEFLLGSVSHRVADEASCPVLIIK